MCDCCEDFDCPRQNNRTLLTEYESKQLLAAYGIPTVATEIAASAAEAVEIADRLGYPVVLKLHSETITHKTDVGGVKLNLGDAKAVITAFEAIAQRVRAIDPAAFLGATVQPMVHLEGYELILGSSIDPNLAGDAVRFRRTISGSLSGSIASTSAFKYHPSAADDGANAHI